MKSPKRVVKKAKVQKKEQRERDERPGKRGVTATIREDPEGEKKGGRIGSSERDLGAMLGRMQPASVLGQERS